MTEIILKLWSRLVSLNSMQNVNSEALHNLWHEKKQHYPLLFSVTINVVPQQEVCNNCTGGKNGRNSIWKVRVNFKTNPVPACDEEEQCVQFG